MAMALMACEPEFENPVSDLDAYSSGEADFSNYVAIGNSLTAGFADNALYITGQKNSYPNILAQQFAKVQETADFDQPLMNDNAGGLLLNGTQIYGTRLVLAFDAEGNPAPRSYTGADPTTEVTETLTGPFSNMGVPGAKSFHLVSPGYGDVAGIALGTANPYFARFASSAETTVLADAVAQNPTFFTLWIGNNDVLSFATSGGIGVDQTGNFNPATYGPNDITDPQVFAQVYATLVTSMIDAGAEEGVLLNIPMVTDIPFFTTVPVNAIPLDEGTAAVLNTKFAAYNTQILPGLAQQGVITAAEMEARKITFAAGLNYVTLSDEDLTDISGILQQAPFNLDEATAHLLGQLRQATQEDLIPLSSASVLGTAVGGDPSLVMGVSVPLGDQHVLTPDEQEMVADATMAYNAVIKNIAEQHDLAFLDVAAILEELSGPGIAFDAGMITSDFVTGGAFSLDGVHLTPRGSALLANRIISEINETYDATVPKVNAGAYGTITPSNEVD